LGLMTEMPKLTEREIRILKDRRQALKVYREFVVEMSRKFPGLVTGIEDVDCNGLETFCKKWLERLRWGQL
jgi:hypothetical protein